MRKTEQMVLKTVHNLGVASALDVQNYMGCQLKKATKVLNSLTRKGYLKIAARRYQCDVNAHDKDDIEIAFIGNLWELTPKGREVARRTPVEEGEKQNETD